jgi:hypothetical protein
MGFSGDAIHLMLVNGTTVTAVSQYARGDWWELVDDTVTEL